MLKRSARICFRLTPDEQVKYIELAKQECNWNWSSFIRKALKAYWVANQAKQVEVNRQTPSLLSDADQRFEVATNPEIVAGKKAKKVSDARSAVRHKKASTRSRKAVA